MERDDQIRTPIGLAISLRDMGNGTSRLFMDDIKSKQTALPVTWEHEYFYTFTPELDNEALSDMSLSDQSLQKIGAAVVARLVVLNKTRK